MKLDDGATCSEHHSVLKKHKRLRRPADRSERSDGNSPSAHSGGRRHDDASYEPVLPVAAQVTRGESRSYGQQSRHSSEWPTERARRLQRPPVAQAGSDGGAVFTGGREGTR
ncbi:hypothetical protein EYF80_065694 [Liparis tanakae]|uniref:Uncharacterized protein n=1 Tax=Liparis tanakae TaxID=230148 RepID=A0A4Z2E6B1_9TELE|nr:hypothetical protein EYF80_065694 [Liparis tanakae]